MDNSLNYTTYIFRKIRKLAVFAVFWLLLAMDFGGSFSQGFSLLMLKDCGAQALLDCSDPAIAPAVRKAGTNCIMNLCAALAPGIVAQGSGDNPNCTDLLCSDPALQIIRPGINCVMKSCANLPSNHVANPNVNCVMPDCATISGSPIVNGTGANCSYMGLPLCASITDKNRLPRINCADLVNLQLNTDVRTALGHNVELKKDSVIECKNINNPSPEASPALIAGIDYAVHNRDCIRFCDQITGDGKKEPGVNCSIRKCHQLPPSIAPIPNGSHPNCVLQTCNLLTADELDNPKFDEDKKYCDAGEVKCYQFSEAQLQFVKPTKMCQLHNCPLPQNAPPSCGIDDSFHFANKSQSYLNNYIKYITGGLKISSNCTTATTICRQITARPYQCLPEIITNKLTKPHPECDQEGQNSRCDNHGLCYRSIDCNLTLNSNLPECAIGEESSADNNAESENTFDAWFYRPIPLQDRLYKGVDEHGNVRPMHYNPGASNYKERLCYSKEDLNNLGWGDYEITHTSISPGLCPSEESFFNSSWNGVVNLFYGRGADYLNLCGTNNQLYQAPDPLKTAYIQSYIRTDYTRSVPRRHIKVCVRFKNSYATDEANGVQACGKRECQISCNILGCNFQACGSDYCQDLVIDDNNHRECDINNQMFTGLPNKPCLKIIDDNIRIRAVQYGNQICAFMDVKGQRADIDLANAVNGAHFFTGNETLDDEYKTCISGIKGPNGTCMAGFNSKKNPDNSTYFRTIFLIPYIGDAINPTAIDPKALHGYYDISGQFFKQQQCAKIELRISPPKLYNLANSNNSGRLFYPSPLIASVRTKRGGYDAIDKHTDFFYPEIEVGFGTSRQLVSLKAGCTGYKNNDSKDSNCSDQTTNSPAGTDISTTINKLNYATNIFVQKEFNQTTLEPLFCLYQKMLLNDREKIIPIDCVSRNYPKINQIALRLDSNPKYNNFKVLMNYVIDPGINNINDNCDKNQDDNCFPNIRSDAIKFENISADNPLCNYNAAVNPAEQYPICLKRDECSKLNIECVDNEFAFYQAKYSHDSKITDFSGYLAIQKSCDEQLLPACNLKKSTDLAYGWFNEACIVSGFQTKLRKIIAYKLPGNIMGKCLIDSSSPYLTDKDPATNCNDGGRAPNCLCLSYNQGDDVLAANQIARFETPHEAGLCVNIPLPETCPPISHNLEPNSDINDLNYTYQSLNKSEYNPPYIHNANGVDISHKYRSLGSKEYNIPIAGHAEFPRALAGMDRVPGRCVGYFKKAIKNDIEVDPMLSCIKNGNQNPKWGNQVINPCVRYSCDAIIALDPDPRGNYPGNYDALETGENRGLSNGFANWPKYTQSNDFLEKISATSCITGFKPNNGKLPFRNCSQLGSYLEVTNSCVRITCPAINPRMPLNNSDPAWNDWNNAGGAIFAETKASRSTTNILSESIATGVCNNDLGYFQTGLPPTRACDHLGNWQAVHNVCETGCVAINDQIGNSQNDGFASWARAEVKSPDSSVTKRAVSCVSGYVPNPYSTAGLPTRKCQIRTNNKGMTFSAWDPAKNSCINQCPGSDIDPVNGVTIHKTSIGNVQINWQSTNLSDFAYASDQDDLNVSNFQSQRNDHHYLLRRKCNANGRWSEPEVMCSASEGMIGNAWYKLFSQPTLSNSIAIGSKITSDRCVQSYSWHNPPIRECRYADDNQNIDQVYLALVNSDCEQSRCRINNHQSFGNSEYISSSAINYYPAGRKLALRCKSGYGHHEDASGILRKITNNPESDICQSEYRNWFGDTNRVAAPPTVTCGDDGNWQALEDNCTICKSCNNNSQIKGQTTVNLLDNCAIHQQFCLYNTSKGTYYNEDGAGQCGSNAGTPLAIDDFALNHLASKSQNASLTHKCYENNDEWSFGYWFNNQAIKGYMNAGIKLTCYDGRIYSRIIYSDLGYKPKDRQCEAWQINFDGLETGLKNMCRVSK